jgi:hypothetical protein
LLLYNPPYDPMLGPVGATVWLKHDDTWLYILFRVSWFLSRFDPRNEGAIMYFWPAPFTGLWAHSDIGTISLANGPWDGYAWDEHRWYDDVTDGGGQNNVQGTVTYTKCCSVLQPGSQPGSPYYLFEFRKLLNSGDGCDWTLLVGNTYGNRGLDGDFLLVFWDASMQRDYGAYLTITLAA